MNSLSNWLAKIMNSANKNSLVFGLPKKLFAEVFPFHFICDQELKIQQMGASMQKLLPSMSIGDTFEQHFELEQPAVKIQFQNLIDSKDQLFISKTKAAGTRVKGQMVHLEEDGMIAFLCSPWIPDSRALEQLGLSLSDFPIHDSITDFIFLLRTRETALEDSRRLLKKLELSRQLQDTLIKELAEGVCLIRELDGKILYTNPRCERIFNCAPGDLLGLPFTELLHKNPSDSPSTGFLEIMNLFTSPDGTEWKTQTFDEKPKSLWLEIITSRLIHPEFGPSFVAVLQDITKKKGTEEQLRQSQKMDAIGQLAGGVAHDFNNLLTVIISYAETLAEDEVNPERLEKIQTISATGDRAALLTKQLLAFSRRQVLASSVFDINEVLINMQKMLSRLISEDIQIEFKFASDLFRINADRGQVEQVFMNLVINARDAMPLGGKITIETANCMLDESQIGKHFDSTPGHYVMIGVSDTGTGMDKELQRKIFEPFFTTKGIGKGTGLGLSTVHGIMKQSGGDIWLYSELGKGTTFKLFFPVAENVADIDDNRKKDAPIPRGYETILLVEDESAVRKIAASILRKNGHTVLEAVDGVDALKLLGATKEHLDLVVTDVVMPNMSGAELVDNIRKMHANIRTLFMSGYTADAIAHHGVLDEGAALLHKPFRSKDLLREVRKVLDEKPSDLK